MASAVPKPFIGSAAAARLRQSRMQKRPGSGWIEPEQLRTRLACARSIPEILETRRRFKDEIELGHLPVAWSRLSRLGRSGSQREWLRHNRELLVPLVEQTRMMLESDVPDARANASVAHAVATAGLHSDEPEWLSLWEAIEYRAVEGLEDSEPPDYARLAWAMVEAKHPAEKYLQTAGARLQQALRPEEGSAGRGRAVQKWRGVQLSKPVNLTELALFGNAYVRGVSPSPAARSLLESIAGSAASRVAGAKPPTLLLLLRTYAAGRTAPVSPAAALARERGPAQPERELRAPERRPAQMRTYAGGSEAGAPAALGPEREPLAPQRRPARDRLLVAVAHELTKRKHELKPPELAEVMWSYGEEVGASAGARGVGERAHTTGVEREEVGVRAGSEEVVTRVVATEVGSMLLYGEEVGAGAGEMRRREHSTGVGARAGARDSETRADATGVWTRAGAEEVVTSARTEDQSGGGVGPLGMRGDGLRVPRPQEGNDKKHRELGDGEDASPAQHRGFGSREVSPLQQRGINGEAAPLAEACLPLFDTGMSRGGGPLAEACAPLLAALAERAMPQLRRYKAYNLSRLAHVASRCPEGAWRAPLLQMVQAEFAEREREFSAESRGMLARALELSTRVKMDT